MTDSILVLNAGSSSLKFSVFAREADALRLRSHGQIEGLTTDSHFVAHDADGAVVAERSFSGAIGHERATGFLLDHYLDTPGTTLRAVGHRVVHGGTEYAAPVRLDAGVIHALEALIPLAPLHQPHNLAPIRVLHERVPDIPQVACFDTAFHRTQPEIAQAFALPPKIERHGVHRYGFHGLSYEFIARRLPEVDAVAARGRTVVLHLGNGASMCALVGGRSVATTMGFTALEGLPMGTRCGSLDPGVVLFMQQQLGLSVSEVEHVLYHESGLLGVSGVSSDMRSLESSDDPRAKRAIDLLVYRIGRELGSLAAAAGGLDAIVFTAGIGENSARLREAVCRQARWIGVELDPAANARQGPRISTDGSGVGVWVIPTDEERMIAQHTDDLVAT
ncbi:MAG: acetate/propionate family kinase [Betaproteobacteria bacterium]|nr:acetate/propionate family kinase [Betaproteobacteria bacterium]